MRRKALWAAFVAVFLAGCGVEPQIHGWDQLDARYRPDCAPNGDEAVLQAWKGGRRYCFRYTIERPKPRESAVVIVARSDFIRPN
jgi:hypothetical protein